MRRVGVLLGGDSSEREISVRSGRAIACALAGVGVDVVEIDTKSSPREEIRKHDIEIAFIALHGKGGEDGRIQKILEELGIPYTGSDAVSSEQAFDKGETKKIFMMKGVPTPNFCVVSKNDWQEKIQSLRFPVFVKPLRDGSSIGVFMVEEPGGLEASLELEFAKYSRLLIEERISGRELTVGILGEDALPVIELLPKRPFYDYEAKYTKGLTEYVVPARLGRYYGDLVREIALRAHRALALRDFSRVDIFLDSAGQPYVLEANSIPGFTETSLLPKAARASGIDFPNLCLTILDLCWRRTKGAPFSPAYAEAASGVQT
ncbi:MAG: D-alanine--D-alanine ligase [Candidatus Omnitrophica bacterium]|nr:D-alanine--D-alanine ligase [Candidatus Omnitrophota bacterium]